MRRLSLSGLFVLSFVFVSAQDQFTNFGNFNVFAGAGITYFGGFVNNGTFSDAAGTVTFKGTTAQEISGSAATTFYNLVGNNTASVTMQRDVIITNWVTADNRVKIEIMQRPIVGLCSFL